MGWWPYLMFAPPAAAIGFAAIASWSVKRSAARIDRMQARYDRGLDIRE